MSDSFIKWYQWVDSMTIKDLINLPLLQQLLEKAYNEGYNQGVVDSEVDRKD